MNSKACNLPFLLIFGLLAACSGSESGTARGTGGSGPDCALAGAACAAGAECCTEYCDPDFGLCSIEAGACTATDGRCSVGPECCSGACVGGTCSSGQCVSDGGTCSSDGECCGGDCGDDNTCVALNSTCRTLGNSCEGNSDCCSAFCDEQGVCASEASFCTQTGDVCVSGAQCCGGVCDKADGAELGLCAVAQAEGAGDDCRVAGEVCGGVYDPETDELSCTTTESGSCCSRSCAPFGPSGIMVCQPPSGCRPTGEICQEDTDCCGANGLPNGSELFESSEVVCAKEEGATVGRCANWEFCNPAGNTCKLESLSCSQEAQCCAGNTQVADTCHLDSLGIPRCTIVDGPDCTVPEDLAGSECASSADCCGLPCVPNPEGGFVCGAACVPDGGDCSTTSDCCSGLLCEIRSGQSSGTCGTSSEDPPPGEDVCAEFGQECGAETPCCNAVECIDGTCGVIVQ